MLDLFPDKLHSNKKGQGILKGNFRKLLMIMIDIFKKGIMSLFKITIFR